MPVGARRTYRSLLKWERKLPCATPLDGIARDLGAFWLLDQWFTEQEQERYEQETQQSTSKIASMLS